MEWITSIYYSIVYTIFFWKAVNTTDGIRPQIKRLSCPVLSTDNNAYGCRTIYLTQNGTTKNGGFGGGGGGGDVTPPPPPASTPLYKLYRYVPPKRQGFCAVQAWDKGYNNSQTPPPTPTGTPTGNLHKSVWQVELLILNLRYVIKWYGLKKECSINKLVSVLS